MLKSSCKQGLTPREQVDKYSSELSKKYQCNRHAVEAVAYQKALVHLLQDMMRQRWCLEINNTKPSVPKRVTKILRVEGIPASLCLGRHHHERPLPLLEEQYEAWPLGKKDGPDAIAMAVATLDPFAGNALDGGAENYSNEETEPDVAPEDFQWAR